MTKILETPRLILRDWEKADASRMFEICRQSRVMKHVGNGKPYKSIDEARKFLKWVKEYQKKNGFCRWAVVEKTSGEIIGSSGLARLEETKEIDLGYLFDLKYWGKGFATEAAGECLKYGFSKLGFREIIALTDLDHIDSQKVLEKIGLKKRGIEIYNGEETLVYSAKKNNI